MEWFYCLIDLIDFPVALHPTTVSDAFPRTGSCWPEPVIPSCRWDNEFAD